MKRRYYTALIPAAGTGRPNIHGFELAVLAIKESMKRRYYTALIPPDAYDTDIHGFELAVLAIKERMKMHYMSENWVLVWIRGDEIRVRLDTFK